jgi:hypothetical protein
VKDEDVGELSAPQIRSLEDVTWPIVEYVQLDVFHSLYARTQDMLIAECMSTYGFNYDADLSPERLEEAGRLHGQKYGIESISDAAEYGYQDPLRIQAAAFYDDRVWTKDEMLVLHGSEAVSITELETDTDEFDPQTLNGKMIPAGGCIVWAALKLEDDSTPPGIGIRTTSIDLPTRLIWEAESLYQSDERTLRMQDMWSDCMDKAGYKYSSWEDPRKEFTRELGVKPSDLEIRTATADAECRDGLNFLGEMFLIECEYQAKLLEENIAEVNEYRDWMSGAIRTYEAIIANGGI